MGWAAQTIIHASRDSLRSITLCFVVIQEGQVYLCHHIRVCQTASGDFTLLRGRFPGTTRLECLDVGVRGP